MPKSTRPECPEASAARCFNSSCFAKSIDCGLKLSSLVFLMIMVMISVITAAELTVCIAASVYCMEVDHNTLSCIQMAVGGNASNPYPDAYNASRYYIAGDVYNPILGYAEAAEKYITEIVEIYRDLKVQLELVGIWCPGVHNIDLESIGLEAESILHTCRGILNGTNIYPYYDNIVRSGTCRKFIGSLGWIVFLQVLVCWICFPICILVAHRPCRGGDECMPDRVLR